MVLTIKHKFSLYRRFQYDIWGYCYTDTKCAYLYDVKLRKFGKAYPKRISLKNAYKLKSSYLSFFFKLWWERKRRSHHFKRRYIYRFDMPLTYRRKRKWSLRFISIRLARLYFLTFQDYQFRKLFRKAAKLEGNFEKNYLCF